jgi:hypothetical protein
MTPDRITAKLRRELEQLGQSLEWCVDQRIRPLVAEAVELGVDAAWVRGAIADATRRLADGLEGVERTEERFDAVNQQLGEVE